MCSVQFGDTDVLHDSFLVGLRERFVRGFNSHLGGHPFQEHRWDFNGRAGMVSVHVARGDVFEKVCVSTLCARVTIPGRDHESCIQWLGVQTFPVNALVPMLMAVFEHVEEKDTVHCPGFFDVYPVVPLDEDGRFLHERIGAVCRSYGRVYPDLPDGYLRMFRQEQDGIGVGYAAGLALHPEESDQGFVAAAAEALSTAYFDLVDRRCTAPQTDAYRILQNRFRRDWVRFVFMDNRFFSGGIRLGVPPESFMLHMLPPLVRF